MPKRKQQDRDGIYRRKDSPYWWASYIDRSGRRTRRSTGTADRREAEALLSKWRVEAHRSQYWDEQPDRAFDEVMLAYCRNRTMTPTLRATAAPLTKAFTGRRMSGIRAADVRAYRRHRQSEGLAPASINKEVGLFSAAVNYCRDEFGWDLPNPAARQKLREPEGRLRWLSRAEAAKLVTAAAENRKAPWLADFLRLALHTGMRSGEMLGLNWRRVDLRHGLIYLEAEHTKGQRRRTIPLNAEARAAIVRRARWHSEHCPASPWVFAHKDGRRVQSVKRSFSSACEDVGITDFRIHDLRHTCAAWLVTGGVPLPEVRDLLGHSTITLTERYAHLAPENVRRAVQSLDKQTEEAGGKIVTIASRLDA